MADINFRPSTPGEHPAGDETPTDETLFELIELLFFAYRDFTADPDQLLVQYGFGRAHHRVIHFVARNPGIRVAELLEILKITKQSLGRVLKQLIEDGFVYQREGANDRRQRLLFVTETGRALAAALSEPQQNRIARALAQLGPDGAATMRTALMHLIDSDARTTVERWTRTASGPTA